MTTRFQKNRKSLDVHTKRPFNMFQAKSNLWAGTYENYQESYSQDQSQAEGSLIFLVNHNLQTNYLIQYLMFHTGDPGPAKRTISGPRQLGTETVHIFNQTMTFNLQAHTSFPNVYNEFTVCCM